MKGVVKEGSSGKDVEKLPEEVRSALETGVRGQEEVFLLYEMEEKINENKI